MALKSNCFSLLICLLLLSLTNCSTSPTPSEQEIKVIPSEKLNWQKLNPARGNKSPMAASLWGEFTKPGPAGFLVSFLDGFSSPKHIHNVSYRGVVIDGLVHNDDPKAEIMWMPPGSFWMQPKGQSHITSAKGKTNLAYIEIQKGPYRVSPTSKSFESGEQPVNVVPSNMVWQENKTYLWGDPTDWNGTLVRIPTETNASLIGAGGGTKVVVIQGSPSFENQKLDAGSLVSSDSQYKNLVFTTDSSAPALLYIRTKGMYSMVQFSIKPKDEAPKKRCSGWGFINDCKK